MPFANKLARQVKKPAPVPERVSFVAYIRVLRFVMRDHPIPIRSTFSTGTPEILASPFDFDSNHTALHMIIDQSHCLHEGIYGGRPNEFPALLF